MAKYSKLLCEDYKVRGFLRKKIVSMAKIHDIGKIKIDDQILKKAGELSWEEYEEMKKHSEYGCQLLEEIDLFEDSLEIIKHHHEHYDGTGYPWQLAGEEIPLGARLLNICDSFDVMTTGRSYKKPLNKQQVITEMKKNSGKQFDPEIVEAMVSLIERGKLAGAFNGSARKKQTRLREAMNTE